MDSILVVEDEPVMRELLRDNLRYEGYEVTEAADLAAARAAAGRNPGLVLLDVNLPDGDGIEELARWRARGLAMPVVVCTVKDREIDVVRALDAGADDYVTKPFRIRELLARVRAILRRRTPSAAAALRLGPCQVDLAACRVVRDGRDVPLTATEWRLLEFLCRHPRQVVSRQQIVEAIWGIDDLEDSRAVDVHLGRLRRKLGESEPPRFLLTVRGLGYKLDPGES
ncbi:MAG: response regulator transcription factor [Candidatus Riflebacteria bacterium]|nr:response regulator transcription factor [Candidatus Riflebacteria bacterium]